MLQNIIRYVRPLAIFSDLGQGLGIDNVIANSNLGGITLIFNINYNKSELSVKYSICSVVDNFDKFQGLITADANDELKIPYDDETSLVNNLLDFLHDEYVLTKWSYNTRVKSLYKELLNINQFNDHLIEKFELNLVSSD